MYKRLLSAPLLHKKSFFLFGARGTGKTQWMRKHLPTAIYLDLLDMELYRTLLANPHALESFLPQHYKSWVVIDEVQRIPELLNEVHRLIEERGCLFAMTGSSARKLRREGVNLLAGRALVYYMHPLTAQELGEDFSIEKSIKYGLLPAAIQEESPEAFLEAYIHTYLREEVMQEGLTRNIGAFSKFLEIASFSQGQVLNKSNVSREVATNHKTISNYFAILEDLLIAYTIPVFNKRAKREVIHHPKFYFFDTGVYRALRPKGPLDQRDSIGGVALETLFLQSLKAVNDLMGYKYQIFYWRTVSQLEVDFILYGEKGLLAFEIKSSHTIHPKDGKGLKAFKEEYPMAKTYLLYCGAARRQFDGTEVWPIEDAIKELHTILEG